jgi:Family of unknown function (DUF5906)
LADDQILYAKERRKASEELKVGVRTIDQAVKAERGRLAEQQLKEEHGREPVDRAIIIAELAALGPVEYASERVIEARRLGISLGVLDVAVRQERARRKAAAKAAAASKAGPSNKPAPSLLDISAAVARLVPMDDFSYQQQLICEAAALDVKAKVLDKAVRAERRASAQRECENCISAIVDRINDEGYEVVREGSRTVVYHREWDPALARFGYQSIPFEDFRKMFLNKKVVVGVNEKGYVRTRTEADIWLEHEHRKEFIGGVIFDPSGQDVPPGVKNLWEGFAIQPRKGDWSLYQAHLLNNICGGIREHYEFVLKWMARMIQFPAERAYVAIVMRGDEGVGKGTVAKPLSIILGRHGLAISNAHLLVGTFNWHLRDSIFLFADEAFFAGDKAHVGQLNALITEPIIVIEGKGKDAFPSPNRLHIMMASNEDWVIPASGDARRYFVLDVLNTVKGDKKYFAAIDQQMQSGGYEAMLHNLQSMDLTGFDYRTAPTTAALQTQRELSLKTGPAWWRDVLHRGFVWQSKCGLQQEYFGTWTDFVSTELLYASYLRFAQDNRDHRPIPRTKFGKLMEEFGATHGRPRDADGVVGEEIADMEIDSGKSTRKARLITKSRPRCYNVGTLSEARAAFSKAIKIPFDWGDDDAFADIALDDAVDAELEIRHADTSWPSMPGHGKPADQAERADEIIMALYRKAHQHFKSAERADLWINTSHPKLNMRKPVDECLLEGGMDRCLKLLVSD